MKNNPYLLIVLLIISSLLRTESAWAQDTLTISQYKEIYPLLVRYDALGSPSHYFVEHGLQNNDSKLYRVLEHCDDCESRYFLFYQSPRIFYVFDPKSQIELLNDLLKIFREDNIELSEKDINAIVRESFYYFEYRIPSRCPRPGPLIDE